jgi:hypothetical protein
MQKRFQFTFKVKTVILLSTVCLQHCNKCWSKTKFKNHKLHFFNPKQKGNSLSFAKGLKDVSCSKKWSERKKPFDWLEIWDALLASNAHQSNQGRPLGRKMINTTTNQRKQASSAIWFQRINFCLNVIYIIFRIKIDYWLPIKIVMFGS